MGIEEKLPSGVLLSSVEGLAGYFRKASLWPATFGLACCAIEMMTSGGPRYDMARFGMEVFRASPRQADLMIVAGRVSQKMAPVLRQIYDQMPNPKWVLAMGVCASSGGMFNNYAVVQGVDHVVPVDMYLPGCPPRPEMLIDAVLKLHHDIQTSKLGSQRKAEIASDEQAALDVRSHLRHDGSAAVSPDKDEKKDTAGGVPPAGQPTGGPEKPVGERSLEDKPEEEVSIADKSLDEGDLIVSDDPGPLPEQDLDVVDVRHGMFGVEGTGDTSGYGGLVRPGRVPWCDLAPVRWLLRRGRRSARTSYLRADGRYRCHHQGVVHRGEITFHVAREHLTSVMQNLRDDADLRFELLSGVSGVHYPHETGAELHAVYHLLSMTHNRRIRVETTCPDEDPHVPSVVAIYPTADWHERETYDFFGIIFDGHPALTRIEMPDDWPGHPQRKDYPLGGIPVEYKGATIPPPDQRRSYN